MSELYKVIHGTQQEAAEFMLSLPQTQNFVYLTEKKNEWAIYLHGRWKICDESSLFKYFSQLIPPLEAAIGKDPRKRLIWAKAIRSESFARSTIKLLGMQRTKSFADFDQNVYKLNFTNGTYDLNNDLFKTACREDYITVQLPYEYVPAATCPQFEKFISEILPEDIIKYLQTFFGVCLSGEVLQLVHIFWGRANNGKSVLMMVLGRVLDPYIAHLPSQTLIRYRELGPRPQSEITALKGKRIAESTEIPEGKLDETTIKHLASTDNITARGVYEKKFISFNPTHKLIITGNNEPYVSGTDEGIWRRIRKIPFNVVIPPEKQMNFNVLVDMLAAEASGIMNWLLAGWKRYKTEGLKIPESIIADNKQYRQDQDTLQQFIDECCDEGETFEVQSSMFLQSFNQWCIVMGGNKWNSKTFASRLRHKKFVHHRKKDAIYWSGIRLRPASTEISI